MLYLAVVTWFLTLYDTVLANDLKCSGFDTVSLHPGDVSTVIHQNLADNVRH